MKSIKILLTICILSFIGFTSCESEIGIPLVEKSGITYVDISNKYTPSKIKTIKDGLLKTNSRGPGASTCGEGDYYYNYYVGDDDCVYKYECNLGVETEYFMGCGIKDDGQEDILPPPPPPPTGNKAFNG